jgi:hypothetical protein
VGILGKWQEPIKASARQRRHLQWWCWACTRKWRRSWR